MLFTCFHCCFLNFLFVNDCFFFFLPSYACNSNCNTKVGPFSELGRLAFWVLVMARNPRVIAAFNAMKRLDIPPEKVKPVLKKLLVLYNMNWDLIEDGNYRTLVDAYFELNEGGATSSKDEVEDDERSPKRVKQQSVVEGKGKEPISCDGVVVVGDDVDVDVDDYVDDDDGGGGDNAVCNTTITSTDNPMLDQPITVLPPLGNNHINCHEKDFFFLSSFFASNMSPNFFGPRGKVA